MCKAAEGRAFFREPTPPIRLSAAAPPMPRARPLPLLAAALLCWAAPLAAQRGGVLDSIRTPHGVCRVWIGIPGLSGDADRAYAPCAVDRPARLLSDASLPRPLVGPRMEGRFTVVVREDGTVDPRLTRAWTLGMDSIAYRRTMETLRGWRFRPAVKDGRAVRSGFILHVRAGARVDTLPSALRWRHRHHPQGEDSLVGGWVTLDAPRRALGDAQRDTLYAAIFRRLLQMRVLAPELGRPYCIVPGAGGSDPARHARLSRALERVFAGVPGLDRDLHGGPAGGGGRALAHGCEREPGALRLFLPGEHPTEGTRVVAYPAGDYLHDWPPGYGGSTYPGWTGRCVLDVPDAGPARVHCEVGPRHTPGRLGALREKRTRPRWYRPGDSIRVTVVARMRDAFQADTLRGATAELRRLRDAAVLDAGSACASPWSAHTAQDSAAPYLVKGDVAEGGSLFATPVAPGPPPARSRDAGCAGERRDSLLAAFFLGGVGGRAAAPVTLCTGGGCERRYVVDPARHTMASRPVVRFRVAELREATRVGDQLDFRVFVDPVPDGLMPLLAVQGEGRPPALFTALRAELGAWDFGVTYDPRIPPDSEISVYLLAR